MAIPNMRTWVDDELVTPVMLNEQVRDALNFVLNPPMAQITQTTSTTIPPTPGSHDLDFDTVVYDTDGMYSALEPNALTIQTPGVYHISTQVSFSANANGGRMIWVLVDGVVKFRVAVPPNGTVGSTIIATSNDCRIEAGQAVTVQTWQNSGGNLSTAVVLGEAPFLTARWVAE